MELLRKYGVGATVYFPLVDYGASDFETTPVTFASGDTKIIKDGGSPANTTNDPAYEGSGIYSLALTSTEMEAAFIQITVIDTPTKTWEDQAILIQTYGNASGGMAFDLDTASAAQTGDSYARLGAPAGASVSADIAAIEAQTDDIGAAGAGLTAIPWNSAWDDEVQSEVADALAAYDPPTNAEMEARTLVSANYATASALATVDGIVDDILVDTGTTIPDQIDALNNLSASEVEDAVWDATLADHLDSGSTGEALNSAGSAGDPWATSLPGAYGAGTAGYIVGTNIDATISSRLASGSYTAPDNATIGTINNNLNALISDIGANGAGLTAIPWNSSWDAEVQSEVTDALNAYDPPTNAEMEARTLLAANYATASALATVDGVVDDILIDTGTTLPNQIAALPLISASDVWANGTRTLTAGTNIVLAKGTGITGFNDLSAAQVNAEVDSALADVGLTTTITGRIDAAVSSRLASASYTAPDNAGIGDIKVKTDQITFGATNAVNANIKYVNDVEVTGTGETGDEWGPV